MRRGGSWTVAWATIWGGGKPKAPPVAFTAVKEHVCFVLWALFLQWFYSDCLPFGGGYISWSQSFDIKGRDWHLYYEWSMMASDRTRDLEETLDDVEVSPRELIGAGARVVAAGLNIQSPTSLGLLSSLKILGVKTSYHPSVQHCWPIILSA